jgi:hypothetical protein
MWKNSCMCPSLLRPVPQEELDALTNGVEFGQNPGY